MSRLTATLRFALLTMATMLLSAESRADWKFVPAIDLRETYTDNVGLQADALRHSSFVSEAAPGFTLDAKTSQLKLNAGAQWRTFAYSHGNAPSLNDSERRYHASLEGRLVEELVFIDASTDGARQAISPFGPLGGTGFSKANSTEIHSWRVSPYLRHRFGNTATATVRVARDAVDAGRNVGFGSSTASTRAVDVASGPAFTDFGWSLAYSHQDLSQRYGGDSDSETSTAAVRWNIVRRFALTASAGYDKYDFPTLDQRTNGRSWSGGFVWTPSSLTDVQASVGRRYFGKTGSLAAKHRTRHSVWSLDYNDAVTTTRSQFLLPSAVDTMTMLDSLFAASYPDPVLRQQAVQAYIASSGLPPTLTSSVNYLTNRYIRARRLQGAATFRGAHGDLVLTVFGDQRTALSLGRSDSALLVNQPVGLNDNLRQRGASATVDYRLSARTSAHASAYFVHAESLTSSVFNNNLDLRFGMTRRFDDKIRGNLEVRRARGRADLVRTEQFHESNIAATLSVLY